MAGVHKIGFKAGVPFGEAKASAVERVRAGGDNDPIIEGPDIARNSAHEAAGHYLVRVVTGVEPPVPARKAVVLRAVTRPS